MLPSKKRIHKSHFEEVFKKGTFYPGRSVNLILLNSPDITGKTSKFAFSVSKKIAKNAVSRNLIRRRGFSVVKNIINNIKPGFLGVFVIKKTQTKLTFEILKEDIESICSRAGILN